MAITVLPEGLSKVNKSFAEVKARIFPRQFGIEMMGHKFPLCECVTDAYPCHRRRSARTKGSVPAEVQSEITPNAVTDITNLRTRSCAPGKASSGKNRSMVGTEAQQRSAS